MSTFTGKELREVSWVSRWIVMTSFRATVCSWFGFGWDLLSGHKLPTVGAVPPRGNTGLLGWLSSPLPPHLGEGRPTRAFLLDVELPTVWRSGWGAVVNGLVRSGRLAGTRERCLQATWYFLYFGTKLLCHSSCWGNVKLHQSIFF